MDKSKAVLYIEDDADSCEIMTYLLNEAGYETVNCSTSEKGLQLAKQGGFSIIILDHRMSNISGIEICKTIRTYDQKTPIIFHTGDAVKQVQDEALAAGAQGYLIKPHGFETIVELIKKLVP
jgi:two-component system, OmpR family, manganese sensing response regulator